MKIETNKVVSLTYELKIKEENELVLVEQVTNENPFVYLHGVSGLPEKFEKHLENLQHGDHFSFMLNAEDSGYGTMDETAIVDLPKTVFMVEGKFDEEMVKKGHFIPMSDMEGNKMQGLVLDITDDFVKMDFNHPLLGKDLYFEGIIYGIREATIEEIDHGHVHGEGGHQH